MDNPPKHTPAKVKVSAGVEQALYLAATDEAFRRRLLSRRDEAAEEAGLQLRASEAAVLRNAPRHQLEAFIASLDTSPTNVQRRGFLQAVPMVHVVPAEEGPAEGQGILQTTKALREIRPILEGLEVAL